MVVAEAALTQSEEYTGASFDLQTYLARSKQLDISDIDFSRVKDHPVDPGEIRCLKYMMDIESHTLCYLRDLLNAGAGADPETADFLACWLYEESYHGRAIEKFVRAAGYELRANVCGQRLPSLSEKFENLGAKIIGKAFGKDFTTVHMTWGAIQEHSTLYGYTNMARKTKNPILADLLRRIAREESRHFGFYYYKAYQGLKKSEATRRLTSTLVRKFWTPVGEGVKPASETDFLLTYIFDGEDGREAIARIDKTMSRLPGLSWFNLMTRRNQDAFLRRSQGKIPAQAAA